MNDEVVLDVFVRPSHKVVDYNSRFSGLSAEQLETAELDLEKVGFRVRYNNLVGLTIYEMWAASISNAVTVLLYDKSKSNILR